jgi:DNA-directed RNA polymerase subunit H (RpoH/RPB5)
LKYIFKPEAIAFAHCDLPCGVYDPAQAKIEALSVKEKELSYIREILMLKMNEAETLKKQDTLYIIIKDNVNETLINELKDIWERDGIFIIIENIKYLQFNILNHSLVPPHSIMTDNDVKEVIKKYNITDKIQFPDISRFDPVARAIGLRPGQVCRIIRPSKTSIQSDYYRICV